MKILEGGIKKYQLGDETLWDMRNSVSGRFTANSLKKDDIVILSDRKAYRIRQDRSYRKLEKPELREIIEQIEIAVSKHNPKPPIHK